MRGVITVEFGDKELTISVERAREWHDTGLAVWLHRNRMRFVAGRDPRPVIRGLSCKAGELPVNPLMWPDRELARAFLADQFPKNLKGRK